ncbi:MAG: NAD(+)/NADH kinase [Clostridia bacterium]|nr:NAD(+)/NADH kinase [Clostridia bacterium]
MNFYFCVHPTREQAKRTAEELRAFIASLNGRCVEDPAQADFTVAIGGDGTMVSAWRKQDCPVIGINAGTLGYLPRVEPEHAKDAIQAIFEGRYSLENRMTLDCGAPGEKTVNALNEAALLHPDAGVIRFTVMVDGTELISYTADGMIVSTPTGSTGYSLSAGGPIVDPISEMLILTPIAPHTLVSRPILLSATSTVTLISENDALIATDGETHPLKADTPFAIKRSEKVMRFVSFGRENFITRLRRKLV